LKDETYQTARYLELLEDDIKQGNVKPIPDSIFKRTAEIKDAAAKAKERTETDG
jgi:hypothetical protein